MTYIPEGDQERKDAPMFRGLLGYFPAALFEVAAHSLESDRKHNPGNPTAPNWARGTSGDHEDCIIRHLIDAGPRRGALGWLPPWLLAKLPGSAARDARRYHLRCLAWRALALLQEDCEATGAKDGASCTRPAPKPVDVVGAPLHPAVKLARHTALVEAVKAEYEKHGAGARARIYAIRLARQRLGCNLIQARQWFEAEVPGAAKRRDAP
jgi:hypothetical protein